VSPQTGIISGSAIAGDAMKYVGTPYVFGGSNPTDGWDCSSFVNWVLGHDFNMKLPGTMTPGFAGTSHGPAVLQYATWTKAHAVLKPEAGDLCIWPGAGANGHIGIATSPSHMVSALNPALGTATSPIHGAGPAGVVVVFKRIGAAGSSPLSGCLPGVGLIARLMHYGL
jgi:cell wall-associated NlpC family hydrolase